MANISDLLSAAQQATQAIRSLQTQLANSFPPLTNFSTTVLGSSQAIGSGTVQFSSGYTARINVYAST